MKLIKSQTNFLIDDDIEYKDQTLYSDEYSFKLSNDDFMCTLSVHHCSREEKLTFGVHCLEDIENLIHKFRVSLQKK